MSDNTPTLTGSRAERRRAARPAKPSGIYVPEYIKPNKYTPGGPVLAGAAKCEKKGHRPPSFWFFCTRCNRQVA